MANQNPFISRKTDHTQDSNSLAAGGSHIVPQYISDLVIDKALAFPGVLALADVFPTNSDTTTFHVVGGRPEVGFVGQNGTIGATGAEYSSKSITAKKLAALTVMASEWKEDIDPQGVRLGIFAEQIATALASEIDANIIGVKNGTAIGTPGFDNDLVGDVTDEIELPASATGADIQDAISEAIDQCETEDAAPNSLSVLLSRRLAKGFRNETEATSSKRKLYRSVEEVTHDLPYSETQNLNGLTGAAGDTVAIVGPFQELLKVVVRRDLEMKVFDSGTVGSSNLVTQDLEALRWTFRAASGLMLPNQFRRIVINTP
jgi:HK97 family phage major capsid protein